MSENRRAILWLSPEQYLEIMDVRQRTGRWNWPVAADVPADADCREVRFDSSRNSYAMKLEHSSFAPVEDGATLPWVGPSLPWMRPLEIKPVPDEPTYVEAGGS